MNIQALALVARYRGRVDPALMPLNTAYNYTGSFTIVGQAPVNISFGVLGPPQLTRENYIELVWPYVPGLIRVTVNRGVTNIFDSNGAELGFKDQGQLISSTTGVQQ